MSVCWVSFRLCDDAGYARTHEALAESLQRLSTSKWWFETTSFYIVDCPSGARGVTAEVTRILREDRDIAVVGSFGFKTCNVIGAVEDQDIFDLVEFAKKV